jgi:hypothetical protein
MCLLRPTLFLRVRLVETVPILGATLRHPIPIRYYFGVSLWCGRWILVIIAR